MVDSKLVSGLFILSLAISELVIVFLGDKVSPDFTVVQAPQSPSCRCKRRSHTSFSPPSYLCITQQN